MDSIFKSMGSQAYDGSTDPKEFFRSFLLQAAMFNWDATKQVAIIPIYLKGKAENIYNALSGTQKGSVDEIKKAIEAGCGQSTAELLNSFHSRRKKSDESYSQFGRSLNSLLSRAMPNLGEGEKNSFLRAQLIKCLPDNLRFAVHFNADKKWDDVLSALDQSSAPGADAGEPNSEFSSVKIEPTELNLASSRRTNHFEGTCHYCKKPGHRIADCFKRDRANQRNQDDQKNTSSSNRGGNGNRGHSSRDGRSDSGYRRHVAANTTSIDDVSDVEGNMLEAKVVHLNTLSNSVHLLTRSVRVSLDSESQKSEKFVLKALFDSGATDSFVRLSSLPIETRECILAFKSNSGGDSNSSSMRRQKFSIIGATGSVEEFCVVAKLKLIFGAWSGYHEFIVTDNLNSKDMIIGRDFLKVHRVVIDHGQDIITIQKPSNEQKPVHSPSKRQELTKSLDRDIAVANAVTVKPHTEQFVRCVLRENCGEETFLFNPSLGDDSVMGAYSVNTCNQSGEFFVSVLNATDKAIVLDKNESIGAACLNYSILTNSKSVECKTVNCKPVSSTSSDSVKDLEKELFSKINFGKHLTSEQKVQLERLLGKKSEVFQLSVDDVGLTDLIEHEIDTGDHKPIRQRQYRIPATVSAEVDKQISEMLRNGIIEESQSPWCSPMMIVKQRTREGKIKFRFVIDMRKLNDVTVKDAFPLPRIDQSLDALGDACYLSVVDAARGYFQVKLKEKDREKTAFVANNKLYQFRVMSLGLANAPSTYSRLMDLVLHGLTYRYCLVYLDDTIIYSRTFEEHLEHLEEIFDRFIKAKLKLKPEKCTFAADEVPYLGFIVTTKGIRPDDRKIKAIQDMPFPNTAKEMIRFLGGVNFYRDFIPKFSFIASILYKMSQNEKKFKAQAKSQDAHQAFDTLKTALMTAPVLAYPDFKLPFTIQCDASNIAVGAVIGQRFERKFRPVMYGSRHLTSAESRYSATERELLAIVWAAKRFNPYIYGRHATFITDHQPLVTMRSLKEPMGRIGRLFNKIQDIDYDLVYQPGASNYTADLLSRPTVEANSVELRVESCINWSVEQSLDSYLRAIKTWVQSEARDTQLQVELPEGFRDEWLKVLDRLDVQNDVLVFSDNGVTRTVVPTQVVPVILRVHHDLPLAGHRDFEKTYATISSRYFWIKMHSDVKQYCSSCHLCQTKKHLNQSVRAPLKPIKINQTWQLIGIDGAGPLPITASENRYILIAVDYFSKFCVAKAVPDLTAITAAQFLFDEVICRFGMPNSVVSDHGKNFESILFAQLCKLCQIKTSKSTFYHPEGNGLVERMIKSIKQILTMYVDSKHSNWDIHLQSAVSAYNTAIQNSIGCSPYEVLFGRCPSVLADVILSRPVEIDEKPLAQYLVDVKRNLAGTQKSVQAKLHAAQLRQKEYYDRFARSSLSFKPGDLVCVVNERSIIGQSKSFKDRLLGPFRVLNHFNDVNYTIVCLRSNKTQTIHYNRLRRYRARKELVLPVSTRTRSATSRHSRPVSTSFGVDAGLALFSQLLLAVRSSELSGSSESESEAEEEAEVEAEEETPEEKDGRRACPVCKKLFWSVNIHIGKAKDKPHEQYKQERDGLDEEALEATL